MGFGPVTFGTNNPLWCLRWLRWSERRRYNRLRYRRHVVWYSRRCGDVSPQHRRCRCTCLATHTHTHLCSKWVMVRTCDPLIRQPDTFVIRVFLLLLANHWLNDATVATVELEVWSGQNTGMLVQSFLPRDAMHKHGLCCRAVSVCLAGCLSRSCVVSKRLKIRHSCYGTRIGNRIHAFEWYHFSMTLSDI